MKNLNCIIGLHDYEDLGSQQSREIDSESGAHFERDIKKCKICGKHQSELTLSLNVDHCHITGKIRGLLCGNCNKALGLFKDNTKSLKNAINYLIHLE